MIALKPIGGTPPSTGRYPTRSRTLLVFFVGCLILFLLHNATGRSRHNLSIDRFPRKVWQSWKVGPLEFEDRDRERALSWAIKNPRHRYEVLTDDNALDYVEEHFGPSGDFNRPDIVSTYKSLDSLRIIQADLLRYLIMYADGGIWADIDVQDIASFDHFVPKRYDEQDLGMIIGIETDEPEFKDHPILGSKAESFCQWTFVCKPRLPVMMRLVDNILSWLQRLSREQGRPISELELDFDEVLSGTGPSAFTVAILAEMTKTTGREITWNTFHDLEESTVVGGVLVLTSEAFAAGTGHSKSGNHLGKAALVKHHFHASSWTTHHPRYKHPIYGEVEKCNWDAECVKLWDANTAFFALLPEEEQLKMIAIKDLDDSKIAAAQAAGDDDEDEEEVEVETSNIAPPSGQPVTEPDVDLSNYLPDVLEAGSSS